MKNEEKTPENQNFMREKVVKRGGFKRRALWMLRVCIAAVVFGLVACLVFVFTKPYLEGWLHPEDREEITLPGDEIEESSTEETTEESSEETTETTDESQEPTSEEPTPEDPSDPSTEESKSLEELIQEALANKKPTEEDYKWLQNFAGTLMARTKKGIVTLTSTVQGGEGSGFVHGNLEVAGALWMMTAQDGYILADYSQMQGCREFTVGFYNGTKATGTLKGSDATTGLAVICVPRKDLQVCGIQETDMLPLGNSHTAMLGQPVIMTGNPFGAMYSAAMGQFVYLDGKQETIDGEHHMLYVDILAENGGFVLNLDGQVIGLTTANTKDLRSDSQGVLAISELKSTIERLANGKGVAYAGIVGITVPQDRADALGLPLGVYVTEVKASSPAYNSGIQNGDILVKIADQNVKNLADMKAALMKLEPGQTVGFRVMRQGKEAYVEQVYTVDLGIR